MDGGGILESRAREEQIIILPENESAASIIEDFKGAVFFKGSRSAKLETLVPSWAVEPQDHNRN